MSKQWFYDHVGQTVIRTNPIDYSTTEFEVTEQNVGYLWLYTEKGFTYTAKTERPRVHIGDSVCVSCEG